MKAFYDFVMFPMQVYKYYHSVFQAIRSCGQCVEPRALMIYWTRPFLTGESFQVTVYYSTEEERDLDEVSIFLLVVYPFRL